MRAAAPTSPRRTLCSGMMCARCSASAPCCRTASCLLSCCSRASTCRARRRSCSGRSRSPQSCRSCLSLMTASSMSSTSEAVSVPAIQAQLATLEQLLEVYERAVLEQSDRLERALADAAERAAEAEIARRRAEAATARAQFLAEAGKKLSSSLDYDATLQNVARLAVPAIADWCIVDLREGNELVRVAVAHADPAKSDLAQALRRREPEGA